MHLGKKWVSAQATRGCENTLSESRHSDTANTGPLMRLLGTVPSTLCSRPERKHHQLLLKSQLICHPPRAAILTHPRPSIPERQGCRSGLLHPAKGGPAWLCFARTSTSHPTLELVPTATGHCAIIRMTCLAGCPVSCLPLLFLECMTPWTL